MLLVFHDQTYSLKELLNYIDEGYNKILNEPIKWIIDLDYGTRVDGDEDGNPAILVSAGAKSCLCL
jgi:hypothetical protein